MPAYTLLTLWILWTSMKVNVAALCSAEWGVRICWRYNGIYNTAHCMCDSHCSKTGRCKTSSVTRSEIWVTDLTVEMYCQTLSPVLSALGGILTATASLLCVCTVQTESKYVHFLTPLPLSYLLICRLFTHRSKPVKCICSPPANRPHSSF